FGNGHLVNLSLSNGSLSWENVVALPTGSFTVQRMVDIDADPIIQHDNIYVATYQGRIACLNTITGQTLWTQDISSFTGIAADEKRLFVSDAKSDLWAFD